MSIGQVAEILTMIVLGTVLKKLGWRVTMMVGVLGLRIAFRRFCVVPRIDVFDRSHQSRARHLLRVLLRDGVHFR